MTNLYNALIRTGLKGTWSVINYSNRSEGKSRFNIGSYSGAIDKDALDVIVIWGDTSAGLNITNASFLFIPPGQYYDEKCYVIVPNEEATYFGFSTTSYYSFGFFHLRWTPNK